MPQNSNFTKLEGVLIAKLFFKVIVRGLNATAIHKFKQTGLQLLPYAVHLILYLRYFLVSYMERYTIRILFGYI